MLKKPIIAALIIFLIAPSLFAQDLYDNGKGLVLGRGWRITKGEFSSHVKGVIKNTTRKKMSSVSIEFGIYNSSGEKVGTASDYLSELAAGEVWSFKALLTQDSGTTAKFQSLTGDGPND